jgi:hypothetical protein
MLNGVGVVATSKRPIKPGFEFENYFPRPGYGDPILHQNGSNEMTIDKFIPQVVKQYLSDTEKISVVLKQNTLEATLKAIFDFIYTHIQYRQDSPMEEQIRRPARSWADRHDGVDCDCYTVLISSILTNLRIPHYLRMTAYNSQRGYQHIYVVVAKKAGTNMNNKSDYYTIDPVMDRFDQEKPFLKKRDRLMQAAGFGAGLNGFPIRMLNGVGEIVFANRTPLVQKDIYFNPMLDTWALKGLDGAYYLRGDYNQRYIEPLNGDGLGFIDTALKVGTGVFKLGKSIFGKKRKKKAPAKPAAIAPQTAALTAAAAFNPMVNTAAQAAGINPDVINNKIVASNKATVMSLSAMDKGMKDRIDLFGANFSTGIKKVLDNGLSLQDVIKNVDKISLEALRATTGIKEQQITIDERTNELLEVNKTETLKNEQFRNEQRNMNRITTIVLVSLGVMLLYIVLRQKQS